MRYKLASMHVALSFPSGPAKRANFRNACTPSTFESAHQEICTNLHTTLFVGPQKCICTAALQRLQSSDFFRISIIFTDLRKDLRYYTDHLPKSMVLDGSFLAVPPPTLRALVNADFHIVKSIFGIRYFFYSLHGLEERGKENF